MNEKTTAKPEPARITRRHRFLAGIVGALIAVPVAMTFDPYGIYAPEDHLSTTGLAAVVSALLAACLAPLLRLEGRLGKVVSTLSVLLVVILSHGAGLSTMFSLAVDRRVLYSSIATSVIIGGFALYRRCRLAEVAIIALIAPLLFCTTQYAFFVRGPNADCSEVANRSGVTAVGLWPNLGNPDIAGALPYDVLADEEEGVVFASLVDQRDHPGCGAIAAWGPGLLKPIVMIDDLREPGATGASECVQSGRMRLDQDRNLLFVPAASYGDVLPPRLLIYSYEVSSTEGFTFSPLYSGPLVIDPSDMLLIEETLIVLGYPRRFAEDSANRLGSIDVSDPTNPRVKKIESFSLDGWMTEYVVVVIDEGLLYVTDVFGHLFEIRLDDFSTVRSVRPGASTLQADVWGKVLFTAAPYAREILQIDRESLSIIGRLPAGNAMREVVADPARGRVFSTSYGEGTLYGWKLPEPDGDVERAGTVSLGSPLRGLDLLSTSGDILVGSGCGVFRINPEEALGL